LEANKILDRKGVKMKNFSKIILSCSLFLTFIQLGNAGDLRDFKLELHFGEADTEPNLLPLPSGLEVLSLKISNKGQSLNAAISYWVPAIAGCSTLKELHLDCTDFQHDQIHSFLMPFLKKIGEWSAVDFEKGNKLDFSNLKIDFDFSSEFNENEIKKFSMQLKALQLKFVSYVLDSLKKKSKD